MKMLNEGEMEGRLISMSSCFADLLERWRENQVEFMSNGILD